jgi:hypothetical protein
MKIRNKPPALSKQDRNAHGSGNCWIIRFIIGYGLDEPVPGSGVAVWVGRSVCPAVSVGYNDGVGEGSCVGEGVSVGTTVGELSAVGIMVGCKVAEGVIPVVAVGKPVAVAGVVGEGVGDKISTRVVVRVAVSVGVSVSGSGVSVGGLH